MFPQETYLSDFELLFSVLIAKSSPPPPDKFSLYKVDYLNYLVIIRLSLLIVNFLRVKVSTSRLLNRKYLEVIFASLNQKNILGCLTLNRQDYVTKIENILHDSSKFRNIGVESIYDKSNKIEVKIQRWIISFLNVT